MASSAPNNSAEPDRSVTVLDIPDGISMRSSDSGESVWRETLSAGGDRVVVAVALIVVMFWLCSFAPICLTDSIFGLILFRFDLILFRFDSTYVCSDRFPSISVRIDFANPTPQHHDDDDDDDDEELESDAVGNSFNSIARGI